MISKHEIIQLIDGTHPTRGTGVSLALQGVIIVSAISISLETLPDLSPPIFDLLRLVEFAALSVFVVEYITRLVCSPKPFRYAISFWGIVDLLACLPILMFVNSGWAALRTLRLLRLVRLLKLLHTNKALLRLERALLKSRGELMIFGILALIILYIAAVGIYIFENEAQPEAFSSIPISLWWAVVSFTTVGYGDIYPITAGGRIFTSAILFIGLGVIAVPTAIITTALIQTDLKQQITDEVEHDVRKELRKDIQKIVQKPKRRP